MNSLVFNHLRSAVLGLGLVCTASAWAQPPPHPPSPEERLAKMKTDLGLSEAQAQKIKAILEENISKMKGLREDKSLSEEQRREKAHEIRRAGGDKIVAELNSEQKVKFEEEQKKRRREGPPEPGESKGPRKGPPSGFPKSE